MLSRILQRVCYQWDYPVFFVIVINRQFNWVRRCGWLQAKTTIYPEFLSRICLGMNIGRGAVDIFWLMLLPRNLSKKPFNTWLGDISWFNFIVYEKKWPFSRLLFSVRLAIFCIPRTPEKLEFFLKLIGSNIEIGITQFKIECRYCGHSMLTIRL